VCERLKERAVGRKRKQKTKTKTKTKTKKREKPFLVFPLIIR